MALATETEMTASETDEFLGRHETGVLSLAKADEPYSIPISYGYDSDDRAFYIRLVSTPDSEKRRYLESAGDARIVVYDEDGQTYRSVVADGTMTEIPPSELTVADVEQYGEAKRPLFEIWGASKQDLDITLFRFDPTDLTGRRTEITEEADEQ